MTHTTAAFDEMDALEARHWWFVGQRAITTALLPADLRARRDARILDVGCGVGGNMAALSTLGPAVGIDYSFYGLQYTVQQHPGRVAQATIEALPLAEAQFDLVMTFDVIEILPDDAQAFRELARMVTPGGYLLVRLPGMQALAGAHDQYWQTHRRYETGPLRQRLTQAGLTPLRLTYANSFLMPPIFLVRKLQLLQMRLVGGEPGSDISLPPAPINAALAALLKIEAAWIARGGAWPAGVSLYALSQKPPSSV